MRLVSPSSFNPRHYSALYSVVPVRTTTPVDWVRTGEPTAYRTAAGLPTWTRRARAGRGQAVREAARQDAIHRLNRLVPGYPPF